MFGYVTCDKGELKIRQFNLYRAHYCGVCKAIRAQYGIVHCAFLTYDTTALALGISASEPVRVCKERCVVNPLRKVLVARGRAVEYAAHCNVFLAVGKLGDNYADEKNLLSGLGAYLFGGASLRAQAALGESGARATHALKALSQLEQQHCKDIDLVANCFGEMLQALMEGTPVPQMQKVVLGNVGFNLGRWIYLIDAYDDLQKDEKNAEYNVLLEKYKTAQAVQEQIAVIEFNLLASLAQAGNAVDLLEGESAAILKNIIDGGGYKKTLAILHPQTCKEDDGLDEFAEKP